MVHFPEYRSQWPDRQSASAAQFGKQTFSKHSRPAGQSVDVVQDARHQPMPSPSTWHVAPAPHTLLSVQRISQ